MFAAGCRELQAASLCSPENHMTTRWTRKDLLGLRELSADEINFVLETADAFKQVGTREIKKVPALRGKTLVNFFVEPSTRTRTSFELAAFRLSADVIKSQRHFSAKGGR
jgi:aspartate carbamoyltransferase catalytic subunit